MDNKDMLKVRLDLERGLYIVSRGDDEEPIIKFINNDDPNKKVYDKKTAHTRRKEIEAEIMGLKEVPTELLAQVDPILCDALEEFDMKYGTNYRVAYFKATTMQIGTKVSEKKADYIRRIKETKGKELENAGISIEYDLSLKGKGISLGNKIQAFKFALAQRNNSGIKINFSNRNNELDSGYSNESSSAHIFEEYPRDTVKPAEVVKEKLQGIQRGLQGVMQTQLARLTSLKSKIQPTAEIPEVKIDSQQPAAQVSDPNVQVQQPVAQESGPNAQVQQPIAQEPDPKPQVQQPVVQEPDLKPQVQQPAVQEPDPKPEKTARKKRPKKEKTADSKPKFGRSKRIQAAKAKAREDSRLKNSYKGKIEARKEAKRIADERRKEAERKREADEKAAKESAKKAQNVNSGKNGSDQKVDSQQPVTQVPDANPDSQQPIVQKSKASLIRFGGEAKEGVRVRFTRKLKSIEDSIRNKKYIPYIKDHKRSIVGVAAAVVLVAGIGAGVIAHNRNSDTQNIENIITSSTEGAVKSPIDGLSKIEQEMIGGSEESPVIGIKEQIAESSSSNNAIGNNNVKNEGIGETAQTPSEGNLQVDIGNTTEKDSRVEYLSSIKVGATMHIENGRYFETPEGTGNYGYFENHQDGTKKITMIGVATNEGYFAIKDDSVNLYELKQKYPEAKFSFHFVNVREDGSELTLGWLTENSPEHELRHNDRTLEDDGR